MTAVPYATARIVSGTAGASHVLTSSRGTSFVAGQPLWLSVFVEADRTTGVDTTTLRRALNWYDSAAALISTTYNDTVIDADLPLTFLEAQHTAPAGAVEVEMVFTLTPASPPIQHTVDLSRPRLGRTQVAADITATVSPATATRYFSHNYAGTADTGQFPRSVSFTLNTAAGAVGSGVTWTYTVVSGTVNGFTSASGPQSMSGTGAGTITINSMGTNTAEVRITSTYNGVARTATLYLEKTFSAAPPAGGGGTNIDASVNTSTASSTFGDGTGTKTAVLSSSSTTLRLSMTLDIAAEPGPVGPFYASEVTVEAKFQRYIGGAWTDQGATQTTTAYYQVDPEYGVEDSHGSIVFSHDITGLTASSSHDCRIMVRETGASARTAYITGTFTGVSV